MKRKIAAMVVFVAIAVMSISGTMAYFTADDIATNVITAGNIDIELHEKTDKGDDFQDVDGVMPGEAVSKIVTVENKGDNPAYVRVKVMKAIELAEGVTGEVDTDLVSFKVLPGWTELNGYYYYEKPLEPKEFTTPLFEEVVFSTAMGNLYQNCKAIVTVEVEAVQVKNNGKTVFEAAGWNSNQDTADQQ